MYVLSSCEGLQTPTPTLDPRPLPPSGPSPLHDSITWEARAAFTLSSVLVLNPPTESANLHGLCAVPTNYVSTAKKNTRNFLRENVTNRRNHHINIPITWRDRSVSRDSLLKDESGPSTLVSFSHPNELFVFFAETSCRIHTRTCHTR